MNNIKALRKSKNLTQKALAELTGLSQAYINELENGKKTNPTKETLQKIADALQEPISKLL